MTADNSDGSKRVDLKRLKPELQSTLQFIYHWIAKYGRVPVHSEIMAHFGSPDHKTRTRIEKLAKFGWLIRAESRGPTQIGYWPIGVRRTITFEFPATYFAQGITEVDFPVSTEASGLPIGSTERLREIADFGAKLLKMHPNDTETLRLAAERIESLEEELREAKRIEVKLLADPRLQIDPHVWNRLKALAEKLPLL